MSKFIFWRKRFETSFERLLLSIFARFSRSMVSLLGRPLTLFGLFGLVGLPPVGEPSSIILAKLTDADQQLHFSGSEPHLQNEIITLKSNNRSSPNPRIRQSHRNLDPEFGIHCSCPDPVKCQQQPTRPSHPRKIGDGSSVIGHFIGRIKGMWTSQSGEKDA